MYEVGRDGAKWETDEEGRFVLHFVRMLDRCETGVGKSTVPDPILKLGPALSWLGIINQSERQQIYEFLYNRYGCRIYKP